MNYIFCLRLITAILVVIPTTTAQNKVKCFDRSTNGKDKKGVILDCSNTIGKKNPYTVENWIRYHAFYDDGIPANRVLHVNLENNNFQKVFAFPPMTSLKKLSFKYNNISKIDNQALSNLPALEELDLSYNSLYSKELRPAVFRDYNKANVRISSDEVALKVLRLGFNNIHSLPTDCFEYLANLEVLDLNNNPLLVIDQNTEISLGYLTNLQVLDLGHTGLSKFSTDTFSRMSNVNTLYLNGNRFREVPKEIRHMPLAYLNINDNPISRLDGESFVGLDRLQQLIVSGMPNLTEIGAGTFVPLKNLVTLYMSHNPVLSDISCDAFVDHATADQWSLRQLSISDNNLTSIDSKLFPWTKLDLFDAKSNRWSCDCRLLRLASYINETFAQIPETLLYYRCNEPENLSGTLVSQLNDHISCDGDQLSDDDGVSAENHSHGRATRLRHFLIVLGLVIGIFVFGALFNAFFRTLKKTFRPRAYVQSGFSTGVKYRPADFEDSCADAAYEAPSWPVKNIATPTTTAAVHGRSPIVIDQTAQRTE